MYHGDQSRHLMIIVNEEVIKIYFQQDEPKTYSFMIDGQLLELELKIRGDDFDYILTPQPSEMVEEPEELMGKHFWIPLILLLLILNLAFYLYKSLSDIG